MNLEMSEISPFTEWLFSFFSLEWSPLLKLFFATIVYFILIPLPVLFFIDVLERKLSADIQMRIGPNRVGVFGILQGIADAMKTFLKEDNFESEPLSFPKRAGPLLAKMCLFLLLATIPFSTKWALTNLTSSVMVTFGCMILYRTFLTWITTTDEDEWLYFISLRQMLQVGVFVLPLTISLLSIIFQSGSLNLVKIVDMQGGWPHQWNIFSSPGALVSAVMFFASMFLWMARSPFDVTYGAAGKNVELSSIYSGRRAQVIKSFETVTLYIGCALICALFLGGGNAPFNLEYFGRGSALAEVVIFHIKTIALVIFSIWMRWSLPRTRIDQICNVSWKVLLPGSILGVILNVIWIGFVSS